MKRRLIKKVERMMLVDKVCELQHQIDEYQRFCGDLLIMLCTGKASCVLEHDGVFEGKFIWNNVRDLLEKNAELRAASSAQNLKEE